MKQDMTRPDIYLFVINSLAGGGAERVFSSILNHADANPAKAEIHVALLDEETSAYSLRQGITIHRLDAGGSLPKSVARLQALVARLRPRLVVSFLTRANVATVIAGKLHGVPTVISERTSTNAHLAANLQGALARILVRLTYPRASRLIAVSSEIADEMVERFKARRRNVVTVYNPVDVAAIRQASAAEPVAQAEPAYVMAMGRLVRSKGFDLLIEAYRLAAPPFNLVIAGEGPERANLEALVQRHQLQDRISFPGFLKNPFPRLGRSYAFVLPSDVEGFPNSLVEAMALGLPVISSNCPTGPAEILAKSRRPDIPSYAEADAGLLFEPRSAAQLAQALRRVQDPELRQRLIEGGQARVKDFSAESAVAAYWRIFDETALPA